MPCDFILFSDRNIAGEKQLLEVWEFEIEFGDKDLTVVHQTTRVIHKESLS